LLGANGISPYWKALAGVVVSGFVDRLATTPSSTKIELRTAQWKAWKVTISSSQSSLHHLKIACVVKPDFVVADLLEEARFPKSPGPGCSGAG